MTRHPEERPRRQAGGASKDRTAIAPSFEARAARGHVRTTGSAAFALLALIGLTACTETGTGFVQIKAVPAATTISQPALYFDTTKLDPLRHGEAVLTRKVGTTKLQAEAAGGQLAPLCNIVVKKNRITTVTVSIAERPPRCQCANSAQGSTTPRTCLG